MKTKKIAAFAAAAVMAAGVCTGLPIGTGDNSPLAITASAAEYYKTVNGFVLKKDSYGDIYVSEYTGNGGNIIIPAEAVYIGEKAFYQNTSITSVTFPAGTTKYGIGTEAFAWCTNLTSVTIKGDVGSDDVNGISVGAFKGCYSLKTVKFTKSDAHLSFIDEYAFFSCYSLTSINLPSDTGKICDRAFQNCTRLSKITIPKNTDIEGSYTFGYMYGTDSPDDFYSYVYDSKTNKLNDVKADGIKKVYWELGVETYDEALKLSSKIFGSYKEMQAYGYYDDSGKFVTYPYSYCYPIKQCVITLVVSPGSNAEKWAKEHKIIYITSDTSSSSVQLDAPANLDATRTANTVTLVWDEVQGASGYRVYKYNSKTKKYEKYKDVTSTTCKVTGLSSKTKYKFKVVALKKSGNSYKTGEYATISVTTK